MARISISFGSSLQLYLSSRSFGALLIFWLAAYGVAGAAFALWYQNLDCAVALAADSKKCVYDFGDLLYFSFITQATVGYGDLVPVGSGRAVSIVQSLVGIAMDAVLLGMAVFKVLKRSSPIVFPDYLVYELEKHDFWFRFINVDPDALREVKVKVYLIRLMGPAEEAVRKTYDTITSEVRLPFNYYPMRPSLNLTALRTVSNEGKSAGEHPGDFQLVELSPAHFSAEVAYYESTVQVVLEISGHFQSTGDQFFATKIYDARAIHCGRFANVNNNDIAQLSRRAKQRYLSKKLNATILTSAPECRRCPFHLTCIFGVAIVGRSSE